MWFIRVIQHVNGSHPLNSHSLEKSFWAPAKCLGWARCSHCLYLALLGCLPGTVVEAEAQGGERMPPEPRIPAPPASQARGSQGPGHPCPLAFVRLYVTYNELHIFEMCNLLHFDTCVHLWDHLHSQDSEYAQARDPQNFFLFLPWILSLPFFPTCHPGIADFFSQLISFPFCKIFIWMESYSMRSLAVGREIWFLSFSVIIDSWILLRTLFVHSFPLLLLCGFTTTF